MQWKRFHKLQRIFLFVKLFKAHPVLSRNLKMEEVPARKLELKIKDNRSLALSQPFPELNLQNVSQGR